MCPEIAVQIKVFTDDLYFLDTLQYCLNIFNQNCKKYPVGLKEVMDIAHKFSADKVGLYFEVQEFLYNCSRNNGVNVDRVVRSHAKLIVELIVGKFF